MQACGASENQEPSGTEPSTPPRHAGLGEACIAMLPSGRLTGPPSGLVSVECVHMQKVCASDIFGVNSEPSQPAGRVCDQQDHLWLLGCKVLRSSRECTRDEEWRLLLLQLQDMEVRLLSSVAAVHGRLRSTVRVHICVLPGRSHCLECISCKLGCCRRAGRACVPWQSRLVVTRCRSGRLCSGRVTRLTGWPSRPSRLP